jgi:phenylalanine-4-hydroxylase
LQQSTAALYDLVEDPSVFIKQDWNAYTPEDHEVWGLLYDRRMKDLRKNGSRIFLKGADTIGLKRETVPDLAEVNRRLAPPTGWEAVPVSGYIPAKSFFQCLSLRKFPTTVTIRKREQLDYLPEPDIFHDVFGHDQGVWLRTHLLPRRCSQRPRPQVRPPTILTRRRLQSAFRDRSLPGCPVCDRVVRPAL